MNKAEQLIACLEGEIAKRDARIVELHNDASYYASRSEELRAELSALKAQEPVFISRKSDMDVAYDACDCPGCAAPVSEAKANGVVMPGRDAIREVFIRNGFTIKEGQADLKPYVYAAAEELLRLAAPVQQVSVPTHEMILAGEDQWEHSGNESPDVASIFLAMLAAAPAAPAADAGLVAIVENCSFVMRQIASMDAEDIDGDDIDLRFEDVDGRDTGCDVSIVDYAEKTADALDALIAAHRSKGVA